MGDEKISVQQFDQMLNIENQQYVETFILRVYSFKKLMC